MTKTLEGVLVKAPYRRQTFSDDQLQEFLACADPQDGPHYFMDNFFYIQHPTQGKMLYHPFSYQKRLIDTYHHNRYSISMMPRQTGKSTSAAGYILWFAHVCARFYNSYCGTQVHRCPRDHATYSLCL
jgi:hypothetical protein